MFGLRRDDRSMSERVLVPANEPTDEDNDGEETNETEGPSGMSYADLVSFVKRKKCMLGFVISGIVILCTIIITTICATASSAPVINPTTPLPITTSTTTATTTTTSTTTSTTTPSTTTTTSTTTSTTPSTTTSSTTTPSTTTSSSTTTTPSTTTTSSTTTTPTPPTTTKPPGPPVPTTRPLPPHPEVLPPKTLLLQVGLQTNYTEVHCVEKHPPAFKFILTIKDVPKNYTGESDKKAHAETAAAMLAANDLFGISYNYTMPPAPTPCITSIIGNSTVTTPD